MIKFVENLKTIITNYMKKLYLSLLTLALSVSGTALAQVEEAGNSFVH